MELLKLFWKIVKDIKGGTLTITRKTANTLATASGMNTNYSEIEAVVNGDIDATNIEDAAVTAAKLGTAAVETAKIKDANVTAAKLATDAVETAKIKDANVTATKLAETYLKTSDHTLAVHDALGITPGDATVTAAKITAALGAWVNKTTSYGAQQAATDGFVLASVDNTAGGGGVFGYTDGNANPTTTRALITDRLQGDLYMSILFPVRKNDYWKVTLEGLATIKSVYWIPLGS